MAAAGMGIGTVMSGVGQGIQDIAAWRTGKKKGTNVIDPYGTLNPEQKALVQSFGPQLNTWLTEGTQQYTGDFTADMTPEEQAAIANQARLASMTGDWSKYYQPGQLNSEVEDAELQALNRQFYGDALSPGAKALAEEQYAGSGGYWGGARAQGVMGTYANTVSNPYNIGRANRLQSSYTNALNYAGQASAINQANQTTQAIPRQIKQYGFDQKYAEYVRTRPEDVERINAALGFLNLDTVTQKYEPPKYDFWDYALPGLGSWMQGAGSSMSAGMASGQNNAQYPNSTGDPNQYRVNSMSIPSNSPYSIR